MPVRRLAIALLIGVFLSLPATAQERGVAAKLDALMDPQALIAGLLTENDVSLVFAYVRASLLASVAGKPAEPPEELTRRAEQVGRDLQLRGTLLGIALLSVLESHAKEALREAQAPRRPAAPPAEQPPSLRE
jgi:hypothetical protein